jgi:hypothetical protein
MPSQIDESKPNDKKPYTKPELQLYGDLRAITQHVGNHGAADALPHTPAHGNTQP